jgi:hypothetical protein
VRNNPAPWCASCSCSWYWHIWHQIRASEPDPILHARTRNQPAPRIPHCSYVVSSFFSHGQVDPANVKSMCKLKEELFKLQHTLSGHTKKEVLRDEGSSKYTIDPSSRCVP